MPSGSGVSQRLGLFLVGIAIGLVLLGFFRSGRDRAADRLRAEAAKSVTEDTPSQRSPAAERSRDYVFVLIRTGPKTDLTPEEQKTAFEGHFASMTRLAEAKKLLIAGPMGEPKSAPDHRGLWIFDAATVAEALELGATDPAVQMGVFVLDGATFTSADPLVELLRLEAEDEARRLADPEIPDEWEGRSYVIATAPAATTEAPADDAEGVLIAGTLRGDPEVALTGGEDRRLLVLDAAGLDAAKAILGDAAPAWTLHGWYSSKMVAELPNVDASDG